MSNILYELKGIDFTDENIDYDEIEKVVFKNRGIGDPIKYKNIDSSVLCDTSTLINIEKGVELFKKHINNASNAHIIVDPDVDGFFSSAIMYQYLERYTNCTITYSLHDGKSHNIEDVEDKIPEQTELLIVPDAGSNDMQARERLRNKGIEILILDHHILEDSSNIELDTVINCNDGSYKNGQLCGAAVVYKFLEYYEECQFTFNDLSCFNNLVAIALLADNMDIRSDETRYYVKKSFNDIRNKFISELVLKSDKLPLNYTQKDLIFSIIPLINALIRCGRQGEKELMFEALIEHDKEIEHYSTRSRKFIKESIYENSVRNCTNAKSRQDNSIKKNIKLICSSKERIVYNEKILLVDLSGLDANALTGVIAIKLANMYDKPCCAFAKSGDGYIGSGRSNMNGSSFKDALEKLHCFERVQGHPNAFGIAFKDLEKVINSIDKIDIDNHEKGTPVDFCIDSSSVDVGFVNRMEMFNQYMSRGFEDVNFVVKNVPVTKVEVMGKTKNSWKFKTNNGVSFCKFFVNANDTVLNLKDGECATIDLIGSSSLNYYRGIVEPQIIVNDYERK